ncbi:MAG: hypothetical protein IT305_31080 [Chloroflexi bacterium]|nr:hypothetical protein [Chloroflexota bacterium]
MTATAGPPGSRPDDAGLLEGGRLPQDEFAATYGESLRSVLDVESWHSGVDLGAMYERITAEVASAVSQELGIREQVRHIVFEQIAGRQLVPGAGLFRATVEQIKRAHEGLLMTGAVEACDATRHAHATLPLTVIQIGVSLVAYNGSLGTWTQRLFRRDLRECLPDPIEEALALLERRDARGAENRGEPSQLLQRAIMTYAERAILLKRSRAPWRMGHGNPAAHELLSGAAGSIDLLIESTRVLEELICRHKKFLFVPSEPSDRLLMTIGDALRPLEYAIVRPLSDQIAPFLAGADYDLRTSSDTTVDGRALSPRKWMERFRDQIAGQVAVGVYRASTVAPARLFYAHVEHAHEAALIVLADSLLQPHRGFPMLIDVAHHVCRATLGPDTLAGPLQAAYTQAGVPLRYLGERVTRER